MNSRRALQLYMMTVGLNAYDDILNKYTSSIKEKSCKTCGIKHIHHNDFCSRECCLEYKGKIRIVNRIKELGCND